jgi:hypothetical protein
MGHATSHATRGTPSQARAKDRSRGCAAPPRCSDARLCSVRERTLPRRGPATSAPGLGLIPATSAPGLGPTAGTSAPDLGPHLRRDWAHPAHICAGTGAHVRLDEALPRRLVVPVGSRCRIRRHADPIGVEPATLLACAGVGACAGEGVCVRVRLCLCVRVCVCVCVRACVSACARACDDDDDDDAHVVGDLPSSSCARSTPSSAAERAMRKACNQRNADVTKPLTRRWEKAFGFGSCGRPGCVCRRAQDSAQPLRRGCAAWDTAPRGIPRRVGYRAATGRVIPRSTDGCGRRGMRGGPTRGHKPRRDAVKARAI